MNIALLIGILLLLGLITTRITRLIKLPNVTAFLLIGFVTAIFCLLLDKFVIKDETLSLTSMLNSANKFVSPLALGFIALSIDEEFEFSAIKKIGKK